MGKYFFGCISGTLGCVFILIGAPALAAGGHGQHGGHTADSNAGQPVVAYRELTADEKTIQKVLDTYAQAMAGKSVAIMEQAVIPGDFSTIESGYPNWTWEDFRDNHLLVEMDTFSDVSYDIELITGELKGTLGFAVYRYTAAGKIQGNAVSISGLGTAILEQSDMGWRIHHLHTSAPRTQLEGMSDGISGSQAEHAD